MIPSYRPNIKHICQLLGDFLEKVTYFFLGGKLVIQSTRKKPPPNCDIKDMVALYEYARLVSLDLCTFNAQALHIEETFLMTPAVTESNPEMSEKLTYINTKFNFPVGWINLSGWKQL